MLYNTENVIERLRELVKAQVPFLHQGRSLEGIDCVGALIHGYEIQGPTANYDRNPVNGELEREIRRIFGEPIIYRKSTTSPLVDITQLQDGDIMTMQYGGPVRHIGVAVRHVNIPTAMSIIHTDSFIGKVTEHIIDIRWQRRIIGVWRP